MTNVQKYIEVQKKLTQQQREDMDSLFIGYLGAGVSEIEWNEAMEYAKRMVLRETSKT